VQRLVVAVVADPDLGLDEHLGAVDGVGGDRFADLTLVAVGGGGVDMAVAGVQRGGHGVARLVRRSLEDAESEGGDRDVVVERQGRGRCRGHGPVFLSCRVVVSG
jgi:hypothetical protein